MKKKRNAKSSVPECKTSGIRLSHASVMTMDLEPAVDFYTRMVGLTLRCVEEDPIRKGRRRAMLTDHGEEDVLEIIEMHELEHPSIPGRGALHHLGFHFPQEEWQVFRGRLDAADYPYHEVGHRIFVRDADGLVLEIEYTA